MKVSDFRKVITHCERIIFTDYSACVGAGELKNWFVRCFIMLPELQGIDCPRSTSDDINRRERVFDKFSELVNRHESLWREARNEYSKDAV